MTTSNEFNQELGALIRQMERRIRENPALTTISNINFGYQDSLAKIEEAIVTLVAVHIALRKQSE